MTTQQPGVETVRAVREHQRRRMVFLGGGLVVGYVPLDAYVLGHLSPTVLALRLAWVALFVVVGVVYPRLSPRQLDLAATALTLVSNLVYPVIVWLVGGLGTTHGYWLPVMPLATLLLAWERVWAVGLGALVTLIATVCLSLDDGGDATRTSMLATLVLGTGALATLASLFFKRIARDEAAAWSARDRALEALHASERGRLHADRLASTGRLAAGVAHEINNPLTVVVSSLALLKRELLQGPRPVDPDVSESVLDAAEAAERIRVVVDALSIFRSDERDQAPSCAVAVVLEQLEREARTVLPPGAQVEWQLGPALPRVPVSELVLARVVLNLLTNAGDALREAKTPSPRVLVSASMDGPDVRVVVEDNGPGFKPELLERVFEVFVSTKGPRNRPGLGLAVARELIVREGGRVHAENRQEGGARVSLWLPPVPPPRAG